MGSDAPAEKANSTFVVTGGSGLIGSVLSADLIDLDHRVVVIDKAPLPPELRDRVAGFYQVDLTDDEACAEAVADLLATHAPINAVIACAGMTMVAPFLDRGAEAWAELIDVNVSANIALVRRLLPALTESAEAGGGSDVVILGSVGGDAFFRGATVYGAGSSAQRTFTSHLRTEFASRGLRATSVDFGYVASEDVDWHEQYAEDLARLSDDLITPADVSTTVMFLLSQPIGVQLHDVTLVATAQGWV